MMLTFDKILCREDTNQIMSDVFRYNDYLVTYYFDKDDLSTIYIYDDFDKETLVTLSASNLEETLKNFIDCEIIEKEKRCFGITYDGPEFLKDCRDNIVYHCTKSINVSSIDMNGLIPNGNFYKETFFASCYLDSHKGDNIPKEFFRSACVFARPQLSVKELSLTENYRNAYTIYAIDISEYDWRIASEGLSGFCLGIFNNKQEYFEWINSDSLKKYSKKYWKNCFSKEEYLKYGKRVEKSDSNWGLDEVLVMDINPITKITKIGVYTVNGFRPTDDFVKFVKDKYIDSYYDLWKKV